MLTGLVWLNILVGNSGWYLWTRHWTKCGAFLAHMNY